MGQIKRFFPSNAYFISFSLFAFGIITRLIFLSPWLEDWDSVQFALALHNYSIVDHQPHPPGYPIYVFLARVINYFVNNDTLSLTLLSAMFGSASSIPLFLLLKKMVSQKLAILASVLFLVTPIQWLLSEVALSNIVGLFFTITTTYFLYSGKKSTRFLYIASFLCGLTLGVRFAEWSIVLSLLFLTLILRKKLNYWIRCTFLLFGGILIWLIPLVADTGLNNLIKVYVDQASYIANHDSIIQYTSILERFSSIWELFLTGYTIFFLPIIPFVILYLLTEIHRMCLSSKHRVLNSLKHQENWSTLFVLIWLLSYLIPLVFVYNLEVPRHVLPLLPPLVILFILSINKILNYRPTMMIYIIMVFLLFAQSLNKVRIQKTLTPPTIAPVLYVRENFKPEDTTLITNYTYRQFQYYAPEFKNFYGSENAPKDLSSQYVIIDFLGTKEKIPAFTSYKISDEKEFTGPSEIFPRLPKTTVYVLKSN